MPPAQPAAKQTGSRPIITGSGHAQGVKGGAVVKWLRVPEAQEATEE